MNVHPLLIALFIVSVTYLSAFLHEVGHCLVARWVGYTPTSLGMGTGRPFAVAAWRGTRVFFARSRPFQGLIFLIHPNILPPRAAAAWTMAGGILAHGVLVLLSFGLSRLFPGGNTFWQPVLGLNLFLGLVNLLPLSMCMGNAVLRSDGAQILMLRRHGLVETAPTTRTQTVELLRPLWTQVGDFLGLYGHQMAAALAWGELLDHERAWRNYDDARSLPVEHTPFIEAYTEFVGAAVHCQAGRLEEAKQAHGRAVEGFRAQGHAVGLFLMELAEGELLLLDGKPAEAAASLDRMATHPEVVQRPALGAALLKSRLAAHLEAGSEVSETLLKEWEGVRLRYPSPSRDRGALAALGRARRRQGRLEEAVAAYERLLQALQEMHRGLVGLPGAADFAANHAAVLAEVRETLVEAGRDPSLADLERLFPAFEQLVAQETQRREAQNRRKHRFGFWWSVANGVLSPSIAVAVVVMSPQRVAGEKISGLPYQFLLLAVVLGVFGVAAMLYSLFLQVACRWIPGLRTGGGQVTFILGMVPWISWLMSMVLTFVTSR